jgi:hypothetical protein
MYRRSFDSKELNKVELFYHRKHLFPAKPIPWQYSVKLYFERVSFSLQVVIFAVCFVRAACSYPTLAKCYNPLLQALGNQTIDDNFDYNYLNTGLDMTVIFDYSKSQANW